MGVLVTSTVFRPVAEDLVVKRILLFRDWQPDETSQNCDTQAYRSVQIGATTADERPI